MATKKATKQVAVIARYAHKTNGKLNGIVTYAARSSNGKDIYCTTLINGKASGCGCSAHKPCYHMTQLEALEAKRQVVAAPVVVESIAQAVAIEEVAPEATPVVVETPKQTYRIISSGHKKERRDLLTEIEAKAENKFDLLGEINAIKARAKSEDLGQCGHLSDNRGFHLMR